MHIRVSPSASIRMNMSIGKLGMYLGSNLNECWTGDMIISFRRNISIHISVDITMRISIRKNIRNHVRINVKNSY